VQERGPDDVSIQLDDWNPPVHVPFKELVRVL
jgi:hypothetical protein